MAKLMWNEEMPNHKLNTIAKYLGIDHNHHHALSDARVCVDNINAGLKMYQVYDEGFIPNAITQICYCVRKISLIHLRCQRSIKK